MYNRNRRDLCAALVTTWLLASLLTPSLARADSGYAALLVIFGPDDYHSECVALPGDMTALELLEASALEITVEPSASGDGVCSIDGVGCLYPDEACFCRCSAEDCALWTAWYRDGDRWEVSTAIDERIVLHGGVDAWVWSDGLQEPPAVSFADICTGVVGDEPAAGEPGDYPAPPTVQAVVDSAYPQPESSPPTTGPTRSPSGPPASGTATPASGAGLATPWPTSTRFATPGWLSPSGGQRRTATPAQPAFSLNPTAEAGTLTPTLALPTGSPTPDQAALLIGTAAARSRSTTVALRAEAEYPKGGGGWLVLLGLAGAGIATYLVLLWRQRQGEPAAPSAAPAPAAGPAPGESAQPESAERESPDPHDGEGR